MLSRNPQTSSIDLVVLLWVLFACLSAVEAGYIKNNTPWRLQYTKDPNNRDAPHKCHFRNWWTLENPIPRSAIVNCTQLTLVGNGESTSGDADGFTFADREFWVNGERITRGVWTKVTDINAVLCEDSFDKAWCIW